MHAEILRVTRFGLTGAAATLLHAAVFVLLIELVHAPAVLAAAVAFVTAMCVSFMVNRHWTFGSDGGIAVEFRRFALSAVLGFLLNVAITWLVVDVLRAWYGYALAAVIVTVPPLTYLVSRNWVFRDGRSESRGG